MYATEFHTVQSVERYRALENRFPLPTPFRTSNAYKYHLETGRHSEWKRSLRSAYDSSTGKCEIWTKTEQKLHKIQKYTQKASSIEIPSKGNQV